METIPRSEYPRPQLVRKNWLCLNGKWSFQRDSGDSGLKRGIMESDFAEEIIVPFCVESELSGIGDTDFQTCVWYKRQVSVPTEWKGQDVWLHFQAADYETSVWVDGERVALHRGGFTPFSCNIGEKAGQTVTICVRCFDDHRQPTPKGKQSSRYENSGCHYTRTTGIWQTVWMEPVNTLHFKRPKITPELASRTFYLELPLSNNAPGLTVEAELLDNDGSVLDAAKIDASLSMGPKLTLTIPEDKLRIWQAGSGELYDIVLRLKNSDGDTLDEVKTYCGMRSVAIVGKKILINGKPVFQRLVLDQGYYPDGIMTAPSEETLIEDIKLSLAAGFNGARLHQKVFEERFLYHADRMGYLVWGEFGDWATNLDAHNEYVAGMPFDNEYTAQWLEAVLRDYCHPSIIGWCPMNETMRLYVKPPHRHDDCMRAMFLATKAADSSRPVLDASGYSHTVAETDVYDSHSYQQDPEKFAEINAGLAENKPFVNTHGGIDQLPYAGQPYFVSEFGGIRWNPNVESNRESWGYGEGPKTIEEFYTRFEKLCGILLDNPDMFGYCYTQLTDVFQEQNGIFTFDRKEKFDMERIRAAQIRPASYENPK